MVENQTSTEEALGKLPEEVPPEKPEAQGGEAKVPAGEQGGEEGTPPKERSYTQKEVDQLVGSIKGGHEGTVQKMREDVKKLQQALTEAQALKDEHELASFVQKATEGGIEPSLAKQIAERERVVRKLERDLSSKLTEFEEREKILNEAGKTKAAYDLIKTYELDESILEDLLKSANPTEMENKALKLHVEKVKVEAHLPEKTAKSQAVKPTGRDTSKMSDIEKLGLAAEGLL